jgi:hypothetical protein
VLTIAAPSAHGWSGNWRPGRAVLKVAVTYADDHGQTDVGFDVLP